jgi:hypothetical protein
VVPRGCQLGSFPEQAVPRQDIPRSMAPQLDNALLEAYQSSMATNSSMMPIQEKKLKTPIPPRSMSSYQGTNDPPESRVQSEPNIQDGETTKQNAPDMKGQAAEYRQFDINQDHEEDAETNEDAFQD